MRTILRFIALVLLLFAAAAPPLAASAPDSPPALFLHTDPAVSGCELADLFHAPDLLAQAPVPDGLSILNSAAPRQDHKAVFHTPAEYELREPLPSPPSETGKEYLRRHRPNYALYGHSPGRIRALLARRA